MSSQGSNTVMMGSQPANKLDCDSIASIVTSLTCYRSSPAKLNFRLSLVSTATRSSLKIHPHYLASSCLHRLSRAAYSGRDTIVSATSQSQSDSSRYLAREQRSDTMRQYQGLSTA